MSDYIDRQAAIDALVNSVSEIGLHDNSEVARYGATFRQHEIIDIIEGLPSAEVEPVKRGKWIYDNQFHWYRASCSECGYKRVTDIKAEKWNGWKYCPNCGARMNTEEEHSMEEFMFGQDMGSEEDGSLQ